MATATEAEPIPFQPGADRGHVFRPDEAPALLVNPKAVKDEGSREERDHAGAAGDIRFSKEV